MRAGFLSSPAASKKAGSSKRSVSLHFTSSSRCLLVRPDTKSCPVPPVWFIQVSFVHSPIPHLKFGIKHKLGMCNSIQTALYRSNQLMSTSTFQDTGLRHHTQTMWTKRQTCQKADLQV